MAWHMALIKWQSLSSSGQSCDSQVGSLSIYTCSQCSWQLCAISVPEEMPPRPTPFTVTQRVQGLTKARVPAVAGTETQSRSFVPASFPASLCAPETRGISQGHLYPA